MRATHLHWLFLAPAALLFCLSSIAQEPARLEFNTAIARELKTEERHTYTLPLSASDAVEILCERRGVQVVMTVVSPDGQTVSISNSPAAFTGFERLFFVAPVSGDYRVEVGKGRPGKFTGSYTIRLKNKRPATRKDSSRGEAMKLVGEARLLLIGFDDRFERSTMAFEKLERSLTLFRETNDRQGEATALFHMGLVTGNEFGDEPRAVEYFEKALAVWKTIDDEAGKAVCLIRAARELSDKGAHDKAISYLDEALAINRKLNDPLGEAATLSIICRVHNDTQNFQKGFETCRESRRLGHDSDPVTDYFTYSTLAALYSNTGAPDKALEYFAITVERLRLADGYLNPIRLATAKSNIAGLLFAQKKYGDALANYLEALSVSKNVKRPKFEAYFLGQLSSLHYETKQYEKALDYAERSLALYRAHYPRNRQFILRVLGSIYVALGQSERARATLIESLEVNRENKDRYAEAATLYTFARLEQDSGNLETAQRQMRQAIGISEALRSELLGKSQRSSYLTILKRYYEFDIELLVALNDKNPNLELLELAWQDHERLRARSLQENFLESGVDANDPVLANFLQRERELRDAISGEEARRSEALRAKDVTAADAAEKLLHRALDDYDALQETIRKNNPRFAAGGLPKDPTFAEARALLDDDTVIVEYSLADRQSFAWLISRSGVKLIKLKPRAVLNDAARELYLALTDQSTSDDAIIAERSRRLSLEVVTPLVAEIAKYRRLVVIADGSLQLVPFAALPFSSNGAFEPLAMKFEIVNTPSFSSLVFLTENKTRRPDRPNRSLAVFADPIFQYDDERIARVGTRRSTASAEAPSKLSQTMSDLGVGRLARLPFSAIEAREIAKLEPGSTKLVLGAAASRQNFLRDDHSSYRILHVATHGFVNPNNPDLSGLVFSLYDAERRSQNGFLRVIDVYSLRLNADLVVLSACQTALGKDVDGEGIVGLTRGFMYAGASSVVSSLWKVEDAATAELMKRFYNSMLKQKLTPPAALRAAQNELRQIPRFSDPRQWAGFAFTGGWK